MPIAAGNGCLREAMGRPPVAKVDCLLLPMVLTYLFVYGTLDPQHAPPVIRPASLRLRFAGEATVRGTLYDFGRFPGLVLSTNAACVYGRLFELPDDGGRTLAEFDQYEGYTATAPQRCLFSRVECQVRHGEKDVSAWVYVYSRPVVTARRVPDGRWRGRT